MRYAGALRNMRLHARRNWQKQVVMGRNGSETLKSDLVWQISAREPCRKLDSPLRAAEEPPILLLQKQWKSINGIRRGGCQFAHLEGYKWNACQDVHHLRHARPRNLQEYDVLLLHPWSKQLNAKKFHG